MIAVSDRDAGTTTVDVASRLSRLHHSPWGVPSTGTVVPAGTAAAQASNKTAWQKIYNIDMTKIYLSY